jgi:hypothetical protein
MIWSGIWPKSGVVSVGVEVGILAGAVVVAVTAVA